jgi:membrane protein implicated in regulation of membrane protease activity
VALGLMGSIEFALGAMTDASEVTRHLFLFNTIWDLALFAAVSTLVLNFAGRARSRSGRESECLEPAEVVGLS